MKNSIKKYGCLLMIMIVMTMLVACDKNGDKSSNETGNKENTPGVTITAEPTVELTMKPTVEPTKEATKAPTLEATVEPTKETLPTAEPTIELTKAPKKTKKPIVIGSDKNKGNIEKLKVTDGQLVDSKGNKVVLKGVSTHGLSWFPDYVNKKLFKELKEDWNVNTIRLAMYTDDYNGYCVGGESNKRNLKKLVNEGVGYALDLDMYVIIDWHILNDQNPNKYIKDAITFFDEMSKEYSKCNNVIYEICNEPNGGTTWEDIKIYANEIIPVIRENNPNAIIIVGTPNWSQDVDIVAESPLEYENVLYALHFYANTHGQFLRDKLNTALDKNLPVIVSEFGICDASGQGAVNIEEADKWMELLNKNSIGYCVWNMSNKGETCALINSNVSKTNGFRQRDLTESGKWFYNFQNQK